MRGASYVNGKLVSINEDGLPTENPPSLVPTSPLLMVHGFRYDPKSIKDNPHTSTFLLWNEMLQADNRSYGFGWYSVPMGPRGLFRAWRNRHRNTYRYAWDLALSASTALATLVAPEADIVCHSLGSRVVMQCLKTRPDLKPRQVLIFNGAEYAFEGLAVAKAHPDTEFFNIIVKTDAVLSVFGAHAAPGIFMGGVLGLSGVPDAPSNWHDIVLDSEEVKEWGRENGMFLEGDNPSQISDHWYSFKWAGNWPLYRRILAGEELNLP